MKLNCAVLLTASMFVVGCAGSTRLNPAPADLQGRWQGEAKLVVEWARSGLPVDLRIAADGRVTGAVGGAELNDGYLSLNRGDVGRWLGIKTEYIVRGNLEGQVLAYEPVASKVVFLPLNLALEGLEGGVTTCKSAHGGGKDVAIAGKLVLRHP